ncbi:hypothetical protein HDF17_002811 [Granulicella arctica]|uniref:Uncharacterized protein n=1 Tax=Granulicella arctica TaxID=940613 RepID=A0A7Y9PII7_9BACT|nr:hypothetical protein [Granulicella arctica]
MIELLIRLQKGILRYILCIFTILCDVLSDAEDLPVVLADKLLESRSIPLFRASDQRYIRVNLFRDWGLDGRHN